MGEGRRVGGRPNTRCGAETIAARQRPDKGMEGEGEGRGGKGSIFTAGWRTDMNSVGVEMLDRDGAGQDASWSGEGSVPSVDYIALPFAYLTSARPLGRAGHLDRYCT